VDTLVRCKYLPQPIGRLILYSFPEQDFWDFRGGRTVTFDWFDDTRGSGLTGTQSHESPAFPDGILMLDDAGTGFLVIFGGTGFETDPYYLSTILGFNTAAAVPFVQRPSTPAAFTLVLEVNDSMVFVLYGGMGFWIPDEDTLYSLGFNINQVRVIPRGGTLKLRKVPFDGTVLQGRLRGASIIDPHMPGPDPGIPAGGAPAGIEQRFKEQGSGVYVIENGARRFVTSTLAMYTYCIP
jgi:hypothetical protein